MRLISNLEKLKTLTDSLVDRDFLRAKVLNLFDKFCYDFPIPMNAWIVDKKLEIISKKGSLLDSKIESTRLDSVFEGENKSKNIEMHKRAFEGNTVTYTLNLGDKILLTKLIPSSNDGDFVFGVSMDITSFFTMVSALDSYCGDIEYDKCEILDKVKNDPLYQIIKNNEV